MERMNLVLSDPRGEYWEGALVTPEMARSLEGREVATIPVIPELFSRNAVAGFFKRSWGGGWPLGRVPARVSPLILMAVPHLEVLNWRVRIRRGAGAGDLPPDALIRLVADGTQVLATTSGFSAMEGGHKHLARIGEADSADGWTLGGEIRISPPTDTYLAMSLYGFGPGYLVEWAAVSQTD